MGDLHTEVRESHDAFSAAWSLYARNSHTGEVVELDGIRVANSRHPWFLMNAALLTQPASTQAILARRASAAKEYFKGEQNPWFLAGSKRWLGEGALETLSNLGFTQAICVSGMVADPLADPTRPLPSVRTRRIELASDRMSFADLNARAYDLPLEWLRSAVAGESLWRTPLYGCIASVDGVDASTGFAVPLDGVLYVGCVATASQHRHKGLAELVMRECMRDAALATGIKRAVLHATSDGMPTYTRMGFRQVDEFAMFVLKQ